MEPTRMRCVKWLSIVACLVATLGHAQTNQADKEWLDASPGCKVRNPQPNSATGIELIWSGACSNGFISGSGELRVLRPYASVARGEFARGELVRGSYQRDNMTYEGEFKNNLADGAGTLRLADGRMIKGSFAAGVPAERDLDMSYPDGVRYHGRINPQTMTPQGKGVMTFPSGAVHQGEFRNGLLNGPGVMKHASGQLDEGGFLEGRLDGIGKIRLPHGMEYNGEVRAGKPHGKGRMRFPSDGYYEGEFRAGVFEGQGEMQTPTGDVVKGMFKGGRAEGLGEYRYADGDRYVGEFIAGLPHGKGTGTVASTGAVRKGDYVAGLLHGHCRVTAPGGFLYEGECARDVYAGSGHMEDPDMRLVYDGGFRDQKFDGKGHLRQDGNEYRGMFRNGMKEGAGKETLSDGTQYEGQFVRDRWHGYGVMHSKRDDGATISFRGEFAFGAMDGAGELVIGKLTFKGRFRKGEFYRGTVEAPGGRTFELDNEKGTIFELLPDGKQRQLDRLPTNASI